MRPLWLILALACGAVLTFGTARGNGTALTGALAPAATPVPAVRPLYFDHLTTRDGLSQSSVMSILQDSQGYLWLATESGLDRYDGYSIREYRRQRGNDTGLASDYVWAIAEDRQSNLWLATDGGGIERWDRATDKFQRFKHFVNYGDRETGAVFTDVHVRAIREDHTGAGLCNRSAATWPPGVPRGWRCRRSR